MRLESVANAATSDMTGIPRLLGTENAPRPHLEPREDLT